MKHFNYIRHMNKSKIAFLKENGYDTEKNEVIEKILQDEACFKKMNKDDALAILSQIGVAEEDMNDTYQDLISE